MKLLKKLIGKIMLPLFAVLLCMAQPLNARAEVVEADLITLEEQRDLTVMFTYEGEQPEVVFISPDGAEYGEGISDETEFVSAHGEGWSTYKVLGAQAGTWRVRCDKKNNEFVDYNFVEEVDGLVIRRFEIAGIENGQAKLSFDVAFGEEEALWYRYTITAIAGEDESAGKELASGNNYTGTTVETTVNLGQLSSYNGYRLLLEVWATKGLEMFDSMLSAPFDYVNPNTPASMEGFRTKLNVSDNVCELDWSEFAKGWGAEYDLVVFADGDTAEPVYTNTSSALKDMFSYPVGTQKLSVHLYYKQNGVLAEPFTKEIDLTDGEFLKLVTPEITSNSQLELAYHVIDASVLSVTVNEEQGEYRIQDTGSLYFPLKSGMNSVEASFAGRDDITYCVKDEIYLDTTPPVLTLYENLDGMTFQTDKAVISGSVKNAAQLLINDMSVTVGEDGTFLQEIMLNEGANSVTVVAKSASGVGVSRTMNITRKSGNVIVNEKNNFLPLLISLAVSFFIILFSLIFLRKDIKAKKPASYRRFAVKLGILAMLFDVVSIAAFVYFYLFNSSTKYMELVNESIAKAVRYLDYQDVAFFTMIILTGILVLNVVVGLIAKTIGKKTHAA